MRTCVDSGLKTISSRSSPAYRNMSNRPYQEARPTGRSPPDPTYSGIRHIPPYGGFPIWWKDYAHKNKQRLMTVTAEEFLRRFLLHTLPRGFVRIRFCGFLANRCRRELLPLCRKVLNACPLASSPTPAASESKCGWRCPLCGGVMTVIEKLTAQQIRRRSVERESCSDTS